MKILALASFLFLMGCASEIMASYVSKSINEPILDYGPPTHIVDLGNNKRAFQWKIDSSGLLPISTPTTSTIYTNGSVATVSSTTTSYIPYSDSCLYTLTAVKSGNDFIVDGFRKPRLGCE